MSETVTRRLSVRGRVQGVGYRYSMVEAAERLGVTGWVRNRSDGSVEALVQGPPEAVAAVIAWARIGPRSAVVQSVEVEDADGHFVSFEPRPTV